MTLWEIKTTKDVSRLISNNGDFFSLSEYCENFKGKTKRHYYSNIKRFIEIYFNAYNHKIVPHLKVALRPICIQLRNQCAKDNVETKEGTKLSKLTLDDFDNFF